MAKFATYASGAMLSPNLVQVTESISGSVVPLAMFDSMFCLVMMIMKTEMMMRRKKMLKGGMRGLCGCGDEEKMRR